MSNLEYKVINAVLDQKDMNVLMTPNTDEIFTTCPDIWQSIKNYVAKYRAIPSFDVIQERFTDLERIEVTGVAQHYMDELRDTFIRNRLSEIMVKQNRALMERAGPDVLLALQGELSDLSRYTNAAREMDIMDFPDAERHYMEVQKRALEMGGQPGISTRLAFWDSAYPTGLAGGDLIVVFGWTNHGKSSLAALVACNAYMSHFKPMYISLEMSPQKVRDRMYTILGGGVFENSRLSVGDINIDDFRTWSNKHSDKGEFIVMSGNGVNDVTPNYVHAKIEEHRPGLVVLDYAQLASDNGGSGDMTHRMRNMSQEYKQIAVANDIPIIVISSATPDNAAAADSPPRVEQVAWSKQLAYDADLAVAMHKRSATIYEAVARKNRNGPLFAGIIEWDINTGVWRERPDLA